MKIALAIISTNKYKQFVKPLVESVDQYFLSGHEVAVELFTDEIIPSLDQVGRIKVNQTVIESYKWPYASMYRYKIFHNHREQLKHYDWIIYSDVDMLFVNPVGDEILRGDILGVRHPGFYTNGGWGSVGNPEDSTTYLDQRWCNRYFCGGCQGAKAGLYLQMSEVMDEMITKDERIGTMPVYHDETAWNYMLNYAIPTKRSDLVINEVDPSMCMVEQLHLRKKWGIDHIQPKLIALKKSHTEIRN